VLTSKLLLLLLLQAARKPAARTATALRAIGFPGDQEK